MAIDLTGLDYALAGQPFVQVVPANADLTTLDYAFGGVPFYAPTTTSAYTVNIAESLTVSDSFDGTATFNVAQSESLTVSDSYGGSANFTAYISETAAVTDSLSGTVVTSGDVVTHDVYSLDYAFNGQPFVQTGISGTWTLDYAHLGQPFVIVEQAQVGKIQPMLAIVSWPQMNV